MKELSKMSNEELWQLFPIILSNYNPDWEKWYNEEERRLKNILGDCILRINHIGSTAVKGITAKPTIDILLEINRETDLALLIKTLEKDDYIYSFQKQNPPPNMVFWKGYTDKGFAKKVFHLHIRYFGSQDELYFRDYLREHLAVAENYVRLKQELRQKFETNRDAYTHGKTEFVKKYTLLAKKEYFGRY